MEATGAAETPTSSSTPISEPPDPIGSSDQSPGSGPSGTLAFSVVTQFPIDELYESHCRD